jgi:stearoyl-CoA desaturase (delta-9 desaturase)
MFRSNHPPRSASQTKHVSTRTGLGSAFADEALPGTSPRARAEAQEPWSRSWAFIAPGKAHVAAWLVLLHITSAVGLLALPLPSRGVVAAAVGIALLGGMGTTACFHRSLSHRAVALNPVVEFLLSFFAVANGSGHPRSWVAYHRQHHARPDRDGDPHSRLRGGFWWAHLRWLWQTPTPDFAQWCRDIDGPQHLFWQRAQVFVLAFSFLGGLAVGPVAWLWLGPLRLTWALHAQASINSICHGPTMGQRDTSRNIWWLAFPILGIGENWHFNHHSRPAEARLGHGRQLDLGWLFVCALEKLGLASRPR